MGAMQAQDFYMAKWAIGIRLNNSTDIQIETAFNNGEIIRTHVMRPTWHFVSPKDIGWMLELTAPQIKSSMRSRNKQLELTEAVFAKSNRLIEKALSTAKTMTREQLSNEFEKAKINTSDNRLAHLFMQAELDGLICSGPITGNKQTYTLLSERVPHQKKLTKEEALAELASRYFTSHGPATVADFAWWSGLPITAARIALQLVKSEFCSETLGTETYWFKNEFSAPFPESNVIHLLPAYDEFLISYKDRSASLALTHNKKTISNNGIFYPIVVINGQVAGTWKRTTKKEVLHVELVLFQSHSKDRLKLIEQRKVSYELFTGKRVIMNFITSKVG